MGNVDQVPVTETKQETVLAIVREDVGMLRIPGAMLPLVHLPYADEPEWKDWIVLVSYPSYTFLGLGGIQDYLLGMLAYEDAVGAIQADAGEYHDYVVYRDGQAIVANELAVATHHADGTVEEHKDRGFCIGLYHEIFG